MTDERASYFQVPEEARTEFVGEKILGRFSITEREVIEPRVTEIVNNYAGRDVDALSILSYASEQDRLDEFAEKLEEYYEKDFGYKHPETRCIPTPKTEIFFIGCYEALGIERREDTEPKGETEPRQETAHQPALPFRD